MKKLRLVLLCLCLAIVLSVLEPASLFASALSITDDLEAQIRENNAQISANQAILDGLKDEKESQQEYLEALENQIDAISAKATNIQTQKEALNSSIEELDAELNQLNNEVEILSEEISAHEKEIAQTQEIISETSELLAAKIRAAYINGNDSDLKILMGADSIASFLTGLEFMKRSSENDKKAIVQFEEKLQEVKDAKLALEKSKAEILEKKADISNKKAEQQASISALEASEKEYDATMDELEAQYAEIETVMAQIDKSSAEYQSYIQELQAENEQADAEIDRILSEYYATSVQQTTTRLQASNADPATTAGPAYKGTGSWYWPIGNTWCYISSGYGYRDASVSGWAFHGGIDLAGGNGALHGAPVYATRSGTVITAVTSDTGYGIYVMIDHGDGYSSLYGHMSTRYVSTGDYVTQGQMIGRVGNTGNSKGAHLHFEIRYYGEKKDPLNYVSNPN